MIISRPMIGATIGVGAILLLAAVVWSAPQVIVPRLAARSPDCLYSVRTSAPAVALTIDDVPAPETTARIRELLARHRARATFFVITEQIPGNEQVLRDLVADGHELGNHLTRDEPSVGLSPAAFEASLDEAGRALAPYAPVRWMRPGGGFYDSAMVATATRHGYGCALGSGYPLDAAIPSVRFATRYILAHARPGAGDHPARPREPGRPDGGDARAGASRARAAGTPRRDAVRDGESPRDTAGTDPLT